MKSSAQEYSCNFFLREILVWVTESSAHHGTMIGCRSTGSVREPTRAKDPPPSRRLPWTWTIDAMDARLEELPCSAAPATSQGTG